MKFPEAATGDALRTPFLQNTSRRLLLNFYKKILTNVKNVTQTKVQKHSFTEKKRKAWNRRPITVTKTEGLAATDKG